MLPDTVESSPFLEESTILKVSGSFSGSVPDKVISTGVPVVVETVFESALAGCDGSEGEGPNPLIYKRGSGELSLSPVKYPKPLPSHVVTEDFTAFAKTNI